MAESYHEGRSENQEAAWQHGAAFFMEFPQDQGLVDGMDLTREMHPLLTKWRRCYPVGFGRRPAIRCCLMAKETWLTKEYSVCLQGRLWSAGVGCCLSRAAGQAWQVRPCECGLALSITLRPHRPATEQGYYTSLKVSSQPTSPHPERLEGRLSWGSCGLVSLCYLSG